MENLKIAQYFLEEPGIDATKRSLDSLGLSQASKYKKGRILRTDYFEDKILTNLIVRKKYSDEKQKGNIVGINIQTQYFDYDNKVAEKRDSFISLSSAEVATLERERRERYEDSKDGDEDENDD